MCIRDRNGIFWSKGLAGLGVLLLLVCIVWTAKESVPTATSATCRENLKAELAAEPIGSDNEGKLRVAGVFPKKVSLGGQLCVIVAAAPATTTQSRPPKLTFFGKT